MSSFAEYLRPLTPYLPSDLISQEAFADIAAVARLLPGTLAYSWFEFECRLAEIAPRADFLVSTTAALDGRESLRRLEKTDGAARLLAHPVWRGVHEFATQWAQPESVLHKGTDQIWLEFDVAQAHTELPVPSVFYGFLASQPQRSHRVKDERIIGEQLSITRTALEALIARPLPGATHRKLAACFDELPDGAQIIFIGAMLSRTSETFRVVMQGLSPTQMLAYLAQIGWPGDVAQLRQQLETVASFADYLWFSVDVGETVQPKLGVDCFYNNRTQPQHDARWHSFLDYLVEHELCIPSKRAALLAYPGRSLMSEDAELWPEGLRLASQVLGRAGFTTLVRGLDHIKMVYQPERQVEAKAYLFASYQ